MAFDSDEWQNRGLEFLLALAVGFLACATFWQFPSTLHEGTYAQALRIAQGQVSAPSELVARAIFGILSPVFFWHADYAGLSAFYLLLPVLLMFASAIFAYAALRLWGFGKVESAGITLLALLCAPVALALYPGLLPADAIAIPLALFGLAALALGARKKQWAIPASILALAAFGLASWAQPWFAFLPLGILAGEMYHAHKSPGALSKSHEQLLRLAALALPVLPALFYGPIPSYSLSVDGLMNFIYNARLLLAFAFLPVPLLWASHRHPQAQVHALIFLVSLLISTVSPAAALVLLLLPAAYGLHALGTLEQLPMAFRTAVAFCALLALSLGMFASQQDPVRLLGISALVCAVGLIVLYLYRWSSPLLKYSLLAFLIGMGLFGAAAYLPSAAWAAPYGYNPLSAGVDASLRYLAANEPRAADSTGQVAAFAPPEAILLATNRTLAMTESQFVQFLGGNSSMRPFSQNDYVVADPRMFERIKANESLLERPWTLTVLSYYGQREVSGATFATFVSPEGYAIMQAVDVKGMPTADSAMLFEPGFYNTSIDLVRGDVGLMLPDRPVNASGQLLLWYNRESGSNAVMLYRLNRTYEPVYSKDGTTVFKVI